MREEGGRDGESKSGTGPLVPVLRGPCRHARRRREAGLSPGRPGRPDGQDGPGAGDQDGAEAGPGLGGPGGGEGGGSQARR